MCSVTTHVAACKQVDEPYTFSESWKNIYTNKTKTIENERKINRPEIWEANLDFEKVYKTFGDTNYVLQKQQLLLLWASEQNGKMDRSGLNLFD